MSQQPSRFPEFPHANVPIVGQHFEVGEAMIAVVVTCKCKPDNKPFLIPATEAAKICSQCGNVFSIVETEYRRGRMPGPRVTVGIIANRKDVVDQARARIAAGPPPPKL